MTWIVFEAMLVQLYDSGMLQIGITIYLYVPSHRRGVSSLIMVWKKKLKNFSWKGLMSFPPTYQQEIQTTFFEEILTKYQKPQNHLISINPYTSNIPRGPLTLI